ncbi:MAG: DNA recombination protein RecF [Bacteroidetes bacterium GWF2_38_335]|nr:MAG: DNA recombination protein RecF [Bacteroidetes bacterium GWF2_38_335]OFY79881.1 MAG: DNA recombination protein RecF [Bacteroidetes bacterium RIFOXYA12_FULL_38_20]HBS86335.1 DNA replication and repair protein RecF [Bacteroidales bacterium]
MHLSNLSLINFKNYAQLDLEFCPKINCFVGNNGVGKTNLLDAVYYLSFCKSYFNNVDVQSIRHDEGFFMIQGTFIRDEKTEVIYCGIKKGQKKQFKRNKKDYTKLSDHIGLLPLVMVSPADINLIEEGSEERRKFIDGVISQFDKEYLETLIQYKKVLIQRNTLLKDFAVKKYFDRDSIDIWTDQLIRFGTLIHEKRKLFVEKFIPIFQKYYEFISGGKELVNLIYESQLHNSDFSALMNGSIEKDRVLQYTTVGAHKDDLHLNLGEYPIKRVGSQGQKKTYLLALKMAQFEFIRDIVAINPILLLDDIFDKLDKNRVKQIINMVGEKSFGQIFISDTDIVRTAEILKELDTEFRIFDIENDAVILRQT